MKRFSTALALALLVAPLAPTSAPAQRFGDPGRPLMTRQELTDMLARLEEMTRSPEYVGAIRNKAREEAAMVRARLERGDIRVGDQIALVVEGEQALNSTFAVRAGDVLQLPGIGDISVAGLLRSELEPYLQTQLARYLRRANVHAESLIRVTIAGAVAQPGFYGVRAERLLSDAIMEAGGPVPGANIKGIYIERMGQRIWDGPYLQQAIAEGRTLDQLSLQAGDQVFIPTQSPGLSSRLVTVGLGALGAVATIVTIMARQ